MEEARGGGGGRSVMHPDDARLRFARGFDVSAFGTTAGGICSEVVVAHRAMVFAPAQGATGSGKPCQYTKTE